MNAIAVIAVIYSDQHCLRNKPAIMKPDKEKHAVNFVYDLQYDCKLIQEELH